MPSLTHPLERHSSLPLPSSPPSVSRSSIWDFEPSPSPESSATLRDSPDTPASSRYLMTPAIPSSSFPPPYSSGGKSSSKTPSKSFAASNIKQTSSSAAKTPKTPHTSVKTSKSSSSGAKPLKTPHPSTSSSKASSSAARVPKIPFSDRKAPKTSSAPAKVTRLFSPPSAQLPSSRGRYDKQVTGRTLSLEGEEKHFSLIDSRLTWKKIHKTSGSKIRKILDPKTSSARKMQEAAYTKNWLLAQVFLYDLFREANQYGLEPNSTEKVLKEMVLKAAKAGKCDSVPARILGIEAKLLRAAAETPLQIPKTATPQHPVIDVSSNDDSDSDEQISHTESENEASGDEEGEEQDLDAESAEQFDGQLPDPWAELHDTPGAQANLDADRFFDHYFLTNGVADRKKTPQGLRLDGLAKDSASFLQRAGRYGLYRWWTTTEPLRVCVGWDLRKVQAMAEHTDNKINSRKQEKRTSEEARLHEIHCHLAAQCEKERGKRVWDLPGQYMVTAKELLDHCTPDGPFTLNISDKMLQSDVGLGWRAGFDLGVVAGSMLLCSSSAVLDWLIADAEREGPAGADASGSSKKRKAAPMPTQAHPRKKWFAWGKGSVKNYELRFRGWEHLGGKSEIFQPRSGHIHFYDETFTRFRGTLNMGEALGVIEVHGAKYSLDAPRESLIPKWNDFSGTAPAVEAMDRDDQNHKPTPKKAKKSKRASFADEFTTPKRKKKSKKKSD